MMRVGHVRVLTAFFAAITLHALLLNWLLPANQHLSISNSLLNVELLKKFRPSEVQKKTVLKSAVAATPEPSSQHKTIAHEAQRKPVAKRTEVVARQHNLSRSSVIQSTHKPVSKLTFKPIAKPVIKAPVIKAIATAQQPSAHQLAHASASAEKRALPDQHSASTASPMPSSMPASAQSILLANIHYPRRARRHGWQGKGEFQLAIDSQSIRNITMLVSTGHAILDRAVRRGLASVDHIAIADGQYRLPVEFRIQ